MSACRKTGRSRGFASRNQNIEHDRHENGVRGAWPAIRARDRQSPRRRPRAVAACWRSACSMARPPTSRSSPARRQGPGRARQDRCRKPGRCGALADRRCGAEGRAAAGYRPRPKRFKRAMLAAKSIALSKPVGGGASGAHMAKVFEQLGITEAMAAKAKYGAGGAAGLGRSRRPARRGRYRHSADGGAHRGFRHRRRRPAAGGHSKRHDVHRRDTDKCKPRRSGPRAVIDFLTTPAAKSVIKAKGLEPA